METPAMGAIGGIDSLPEVCLLFAVKHEVVE